MNCLACMCEWRQECVNVEECMFKLSGKGLCVLCVRANSGLNKSKPLKYHHWFILLLLSIFECPFCTTTSLQKRDSLARLLDSQLSREHDARNTCSHFFSKRKTPTHSSHPQASAGSQTGALLLQYDAGCALRGCTHTHTPLAGVWPGGVTVGRIL